MRRPHPRKGVVRCKPRPTPPKGTRRRRRRGRTGLPSYACRAAATPVSRLEMPFRRVRARLVAGALTGGAPTSSRGSPIPRRKDLLSDAVTQEGASCQVRSRTQSPCLHQAVVEIRGIPFCEACAREQEAYFAIGELTQEETRDLRGEPLSKSLGETLGEMLDGMSRQRTDDSAAATPLDLPSVDKTWRFAPTKS
jgi:hypothetical protein